MKSRTIRIISLFAIVSIIGILLVQISWLKQAFDLKEKQFNQTASIALQNVAEKILTFNQQPIPLSGLVNQVSGNYFVIMINGEIQTSVLEYLLKAEFEKRNLLFDFEYGVYNCSTQKIVYGNYVSYKTTEIPASKRDLPVWKNDQYYFVVLFPNKNIGLFTQLGVWLFLSLVLILVCLFFSYSVFVILKQKRLWEVQHDFVNNMTHEFKTPLSAILVSTKLLRKKEINQSPEKIETYTQVIHKETIRLKNLVENVLKSALLDKRKIKLNFETVNVHECLNNAAKSIALLLEQKNSQMKLELNATEFFVKADAMHLTNVFYNLLDNAVKYSSETPEIRITTQNLKNKMLISITDRGFGINKKELRKIFDKFYRVSTGNIHDNKGFGLGLYYAKSIIKLFKGTISVESRFGEGSEFTVTLFLQQ